ncbi:uncharacterized protein LOC142162195 [Nicotiana tabacum]|uniref:Uncharacterized protein LOC142162195 n=1 Tax=Nicotiana tabacum TaxID=4097 RepID=A0AC58RPL2_TOBAC
MAGNEEVDDYQTSAQSVDQVDHHHPLYIYPLDTQDYVLISIQLQGSESYSIWSRSLKIVLHCKNKLGFVLGTYKKRAAYLHKEIATLTQGVSSMSVYFSRLRELWDEYETFTPPPSCGYPESKKHVEHYQLQKFYQFLTGLNDSYESAKNQVLMTRLLPNLNQAYAMIINVESQRITEKSVYGSNDNNEVVAMMSNRAQNIGHNGGSNNSGGYTNTGYSRGYKPKNFFNKSIIQCDYYKRKGHTKENCFKLHGYPSDFNNKRRGGGFNVQANNVNNNMNHIENNYGNLPLETAPAQFFTPEQYQQILQMLNKGKDTELVANSSTTGIAGTLHAFISTLVDNDWIVDTGASNHMVHCLNLLDSYEEVSEKDKNKVQLPTGEQAFIKHTGICSFFRNKKIQNILHITDFKYNLLSVSKITKELRCLMAFFPGFYVFQEFFGAKVLGIGREELGLYFLKAADKQTPEHHTLPSTAPSLFI